MATQPNTTSRRNLLAGMAFAVPLAALPLVVPACTPKANAATVDGAAWARAVQKIADAQSAFDTHMKTVLNPVCDLYRRNKNPALAEAVRRADDESSELSAALCVAEDDLIALPAPDAEALAFKAALIVKIGEGSVVEHAWLVRLAADARRLAGLAVA